MDVTTTAGSAPRLPAGAREVTIDRGDGVNSLDPGMLAELGRALTAAEAAPACRLLVISSGQGAFCTGMDLAAAGRAGEASGATAEAGGDFFDLLHQMTRAAVVVATLVDGEVAGGGVGLVAASDLVYATPRARFVLPEALWGLLPCCVLPFLVRRVGFQRAYGMALSTQPVDLATAAGWGLVDQAGADAAQAVRQLALRLSRIDKRTIADLKQYAGRIQPIATEARQQAVRELGRLIALPEVRGRLSTFANHQRYPWEG